MTRGPTPKEQFAPSPKAVAGGTLVVPADVQEAISALQSFGARSTGEGSGRPFGDTEAQAITVLYHRYAGALLKVAGYFMKDEMDARTVVHDVFIQLPRKLQAYQQGKLEAWLKKVTTLCALQAIRKTRLRREDPIDEVELSDSNEVDEGDFEALEHADELRRAVERLPIDLREVVILKTYLEFSHEEIGESLGISTNASEVRFHRARKRLMAILRTQT